MDGLGDTMFDDAVIREEASDAADRFDDRLAESAPLAFRVAYSVLRQRQDAEDVAQEALVRAYRKIGSLRDSASFRAWLVRIASRLALDFRRSGRRREIREQVFVEAPRPGPDELAAQDEFRERLWVAIDALPEPLRLVVVLGSLEGHTMSELSRLLDLPEGTVKSRLHEARKRLAEALR
jgi:RNA polymerase sigma-70 factor (ECF subfamily)